ncbi:hypothetical protein MRX96_054330 [Rhipicephalus microplus]
MRIAHVPQERTACFADATEIALRGKLANRVTSCSRGKRADVPTECGVPANEDAVRETVINLGETEALVASRTDEIATEHRNASSTRPGTRPLLGADAEAASTGSATSTPTQLATTSPEDSMDHEGN